MGESKRREDLLGKTRRIRFEGYELTDLVTFLLVLYTQNPNQPNTSPPKKLDRDKRRQLRQALDQLGVLEFWRKARKGVDGTLKKEDLPTSQVRELSVDSIKVLLSHLSGEMDGRDALNVGDIEDRLEDALAGIYVVDEDAEPTPAVPEPTPIAGDVPSA